MPVKRKITTNVKDILFRNRNRSYGAYELWKTEVKREGVALFGGLGFVVFALLMIMGFRDLCTCPPAGYSSAPPERTAAPDDTVVLDDSMFRELLDLLSNESSPAASQSTTREHVVPIVTSAAASHATIHNTDDLLGDVAIGFKDFVGEPGEIPHIDLGEGEAESKFPTVTAPPPARAPELPDPKTWVLVDQMPKALNMDEVRKRVSYPEACRKMGIEGTVMIRVLVDENGRIIKHQLERTPHPLLTDEVVRLVNTLRFEPALQGGKPLKFWVNVPFKFSLNQ